jgi:hypothetical protein
MAGRAHARKTNPHEKSDKQIVGGSGEETRRKAIEQEGTEAAETSRSTCSNNARSLKFQVSSLRRRQ